MKRFHAAGICDCCDTPVCVDCGEPLDFAWFDGRCSACGDAKYDREHPPNRDIGSTENKPRRDASVICPLLVVAGILTGNWGET